MPRTPRKYTGPVDWKEFGRRLAEARHDAGYASIDDFTVDFVKATTIEISSRQMRRIEKGTHRPNADVLIALLGFLKREWPGDFLTNSFINYAKEDCIVFVPLTTLRAVEKYIELPPLPEDIDVEA